MNVRRLRAIQKRILKRPRGLDMNYFARIPDTSELALENAPPICGTVLCIAGQAVDIAGEFKPIFDYVSGFGTVKFARNVINKDGHVFEYTDAAMMALGLTEPQALRLFYVDNWPRQFGHRYDASDNGRRNMKNLAERAKITSERIDYFIKTGGR